MQFTFWAERLEACGVDNDARMMQFEDRSVGIRESCATHSKKPPKTFATCPYGHLPTPQTKPKVLNQGPKKPNPGPNPPKSNNSTPKNATRKDSQCP